MTDEAMSPLRRRMIEDMTIRKLAPKTQQGYIRTIKDFATFLGRSPDTASFEDVRRFQLHLAANGAHIPILNHTVAALRFFFRVTLRRSDIIEHTTFLHELRKFPRRVSVCRETGGRGTGTNSFVSVGLVRKMAHDPLSCCLLLIGGEVNDHAIGLHHPIGCLHMNPSHSKRLALNSGGNFCSRAGL